MIISVTKGIQVGNLLKVILAHIRRIESMNTKLNLSHQEGRVLLLVGLKKLCIMREIAESLQIANSSLTGIIDRLEKIGIVKREQDPKNRRIIKVSLTNKGEEKYEIYAQECIHWGERVLNTLNEKEQDLYLQLNKKIEHKLREEIDRLSKSL